MNSLSFRSRIQQRLTPFVLLVLNTLLRLVRIFAEGWRGWSGIAIAGALLFTGYASLQPTMYQSEGTVTLTPRYWLEGYMLATQELTRHYAARLTGDDRVERAMAEADTDIEPTVNVESQPGMMIALVVEHPDAAVAEAFTRVLMADLRDEILLENRTRIENDRLTIDLSPTSFARPTLPPWQWFAGAGALAGFAVGLVGVYGVAFWRRGRVRTDSEARQVVGLPTLGMIPRR